MMADQAELPATVLSNDDPAPVEIVNPQGTSPYLLICEHAGQAVPSGLGDLGIPAAELNRHIGWDIGAIQVARELSGLLDAPLIAQPYSRLVIDCNRPWEADDLTPELADGTVVPANRRIPQDERSARFAEIHQTFHRQIAEVLDRRPLSRILAVHSFTPTLQTDLTSRPWHLGLLSRSGSGLAHALGQAIASAAPDLNVAHNEPYSISDSGDYTIPFHAERRGLPHVLVEIRNDGLRSPGDCRSWAELLSTACAGIGEEADI